MSEKEEVDSQLVAENVGFLDLCFDNTFSLKSSLKTLKKFKDEFEEENNYYDLRSSKSAIKNSINNEKSLIETHATIRECSRNIASQECIDAVLSGQRELSAWGLPRDIVENYASKGIRVMFEWQAACLSNSKVLLDSANLVYSAPTSAGKTLVAEVLAIKTVLERHKKVIVILPFVSVVREKVIYFQQIFSSSGVRVEGFMGSHAPPGGFQAVHIAICTIEKANSLVNRLMDEGNIAELGAVVVDEMHLLGDSSRGYILELLLTKIKYVVKKIKSIQIQIVGMSATLPNLNLLSNWLEAELFVTEFRPIPLEEHCLVGSNVMDKSMNVVRKIHSIDELGSSGDNILQICLETLKEGCSVLIFCTTKNWCENLAQLIASTFYKMGSSNTPSGQLLRDQLNSESISEVLEQLKLCPAGLDTVLKSTISFAVAFHHAGLTFDERDIIEGAFKSGALRILVATSTLSSGVNLPARRVIIRSPVFQKKPINILTYKQMIGRAGRMGKDVKGESILICTESEKKIAMELMSGALEPVTSCIEGGDKYMRAILEVIASQIASTKSELELYTNCTLLYYEDNLKESNESILDETLICLANFELVRIQENDNDALYVATPLGKACLSSSMAPNDGLSLFCELQKARQCLVLETDLHLIYLVTPYSVSGQWPNIDWLHLLNLWESLPKAMKRVGELVGVQESFMSRCVRGTIKFANVQSKVQIHKRFYTALALQDLVNEVSLGEVADKFRCCRGLLQSLQQSAATFAGMVTVFCHQLGWKNIEMLVSQFQDRLHFGIQSELLDLMRLPSLNGLRARSIFNAGFESVCMLASADINLVENALYQVVPFQSEKCREGDDITDAYKRNKVKNIWITGHCGMTAKQAAENLISEARNHILFEMGVKEIKWKQKNQDSNLNECQKHNVEIIGKENSKLEPFAENINKNTSATFFSDNQEAQNLHQVENVNCADSINDTLLDKGIITIDPPKDIFEENRKELINCKLEQHSLPNEEMWETLDMKEINSIIRSDASNSKMPDTIWPPICSSVPINVINSFVINNLHTITPDVSMFSSDDPDSPNLFEESLPVDTQLLKQVDENHIKKTALNVSRKRKIDSNIFFYNASAFKDGFQSTFDVNNVDGVISVDDDNNDIILHYEEEMRDASPDNINDTAHEEISSSQESSVMSSIHSTLNLGITSLQSKNKHHSKLFPSMLFSNCAEPQAKKIKLISDHLKPFWEKTGCNKNIKNVVIQKIVHQMKLRKLFGSKNDLETQSVTCVFIKTELYLDFLDYLDSKKDAALFLNVDLKIVKDEHLIGDKIINKSKIQGDNKNKFNHSQLKGLCLYFGKDVCFYIDFSVLNEYLEVIIIKINSWLRRLDVKLRLHSTKFNYTHLKQCNIQLQSRCLDTSLMEWLIDSDTIETSITRLIKKYCEQDVAHSYEASKNFVATSQSNKINNELLTCVKAWGVFNVSEKQITCLQNQYNNVYQVLGLETQIANILSESENCGLRVDKKLASQMLLDVKNSQESLQAKAYQLHGHRFNFNSSKDVAKALGMYKGRKVSTKKSVLTAHNSPLASIITYWRKLNAILTRTLYPLTAKAVLESKNSRIHASYITHTCTGRISMHEPNLQNVPRNFTIPASLLAQETGSDYGNPEDLMEFSCRSIFLASSGWIIVSADYCQLEMRILTHMCGDKILTEIMNSDMDVFTSIAASWGSVSEECVDDDLRQRAKQLCYGIIYGMGTRTLAQQLDVSELEAAVFVESFHSTYPAIRQFTKRVIADCRDKGYIETLKQRRRYLPTINSKKIAEKNSAERQAVNTTIQGSAADIAKAAMCAVDEHVTLCGEASNVRLLLQLHDELIYEVLENRKEFFLDTLKHAMEQTERLKVPLPVKIKTGYTWGTLEELKRELQLAVCREESIPRRLVPISKPKTPPCDHTEMYRFRKGYSAGWMRLHDVSAELLEGKLSSTRPNREWLSRCNDARPESDLITSQWRAYGSRATQYGSASRPETVTGEGRCPRVLN